MSIRRRRELHKRFQEAARRTLRARGDYDEESVSDALADGTWTNDPVVAWFLGTDVEPPLAVRLRGVLGSDVEFTFATRRTIEALATVHAGEADTRRRSSSETSGVLPTAREASRRRLRALRDRLRVVGR